MAQTQTRLAIGPDGGVIRRTYKIPFRPEYVLVAKDGAQDIRDMEPISQTTGRDISAFRFHLSPEAVKLIMAQDPNVKEYTGYCSVSIHFDASEGGLAWIEASRGVLETEVAK